MNNSGIQFALSLQPNDCFPRNVSQTGTQIQMHTNVHPSTGYKNKGWETMRILIHEGMDK